MRQTKGKFLGQCFWATDRTNGTKFTVSHQKSTRSMMYRLILDVHWTASPLFLLQPSKGVNMQQTCKSGLSLCGICATLLSPFLSRSPRLSPPHCSEVTVYACVFVCVYVCALRQLTVKVMLHHTTSSGHRINQLLLPPSPLQ